MFLRRTKNDARRGKMQHTLVIIKPDAYERGLDGLVRERVTSNGLSVSLHVWRRLTRSLAGLFYHEFDFEPHFSELIEYMCRRPVEVMIVSGEKAVSRVREIVGVTWSGQGIRGEFATNYIYNLVHAADSIGSANREIKMFFGEQGKPYLMEPYTIFALAGMSESGKSTAGNYLDFRGIHRLKIRDLIEEVRLTKGFTDLGQDEFNERMSHERPYWLWSQFLKPLEVELGLSEIPVCSIESFGVPAFADFLRECYGNHFVLVYFDVDYEIRVLRQMQREGVGREGAIAIMQPKDEFKEKEYQVPQLLKMADVVIDNNGTREQLYGQLDQMVNKYLGGLKSSKGLSARVK